MIQDLRKARPSSSGARWAMVLFVGEEKAAWTDSGTTACA